MMTYHACSKCDAPVRRSRRKNLLEFLIGPILLPYRCTICDRREMKLRFIDMEPPPLAEQEADLIVPEPTEREQEDARKAEQKAAEKAAKKAAAKLKKEERAKARSARGKIGEDEPDAEPESPPTPLITPQSHTSDEEEEQISPS
jgi:hypothetical protein